jgi:hypothetical protein
VKIHKSIVGTLVVAGVGFLPATASATPEQILNNLKSAVGFVEIKYNNFDMGTVYDVEDGVYGGAGSTSADPKVAAGVSTLDGLNSFPATGAFGSEDSWGIARIVSIEDSLGITSLYTAGQFGTEMTVMFYGIEDYYLDSNSDRQITNGTGMVLDIYVGSSAANTFDSTLGSGGRTAFDQYTTVTDGELVLRLVSIGGHINIGDAEGGADAEFRSLFRPANNTGDGQAFLAVVGGSWASYFDSNVFDGTDPLFSSAYAANQALGLNYDPADAFLKFETFPTTVGDWLVRSNDPLRLQIIDPIPEPLTASLGLMGLGALLVSATRRRR